MRALRVRGQAHPTLDLAPEARMGMKHWLVLVVPWIVAAFWTGYEVALLR